MISTEALRCWAEIDLAALRHNAAVTRRLAGENVALLAVIKANGYGHGLTAVAKALAREAQLFGVANLHEAIEARAAVPHPIMIMGPALPAERAEIVARGFLPSVSSYKEAQEFSRAASPSPVALNCKIDTGMGRMGMPEAEAVHEIRAISRLSNARIHSVSSHLPSADDDADYTRAQLARFGRLVDELRREAPAEFAVHALAGAGVLGYSDSAYDIVRAGLMLYGISPLRDRQELFLPVMTLKTRVVLLRDVAAGSSISYGRTFIARRPMRVATLGIGYADGLPRLLSNCGAVLIDGRRCPIVGRVTMDLTLADVTDGPAVRVGDEAVMIGRQGGERILATEVADHASTIAWEVFTGIGSRVTRVYV